MKTVKDYLDSGLALVNGDVCQTDLNKGLGVDARLYPRLHRFERDWHEYANIGSTSFDDCELVSAVWRDKPGIDEGPLFIGLIDAKCGDVTVSGVKVGSLNWGSNSSITQWRPHIEVTSMKTVVDAVNECRGVWVGGSDTSTLWLLDDSVPMQYGDTITERTVCTRDEFEQCVAEMTEGLFVPEPK